MTADPRHSMHRLRPSPNDIYFVFLGCRITTEKIMVKNAFEYNQVMDSLV
jgi:hypothetical protein